MKLSVLLITLTTLLVSTPVLAEPEITVTTGVRTENHRQNGGVILSRNPILLTTMEVKDESGGLYGKIWSTTGAPSDTEVRLGIGISKPCLGGLTCRGEVGYWDTPQLGQGTGDILAFSGQVSGSLDLNEYEVVGFSAQAEHLDVKDRLGTQIIRTDINYKRSVRNVPIIFQVGIAHNTRPGWYHGLGSVSAPIQLHSRLTLTPTVEVLIPINDRGSRRSGVSAGLSITGRF